MVTLLPLAISKACPSSPKPVTSEHARTGVLRITADARSFNATIDATAALTLAGDALRLLRPVLMIPGLNSAASVWTETCAALQPGVQCHIVQLPGFAGAPAVSTTGRAAAAKRPSTPFPRKTGDRQLLLARGMLTFGSAES